MLVFQGLAKAVLPNLWVDPQLAPFIAPFRKHQLVIWSVSFGSPIGLAPTQDQC